MWLTTCRGPDLRRPCDADYMGGPAASSIPFASKRFHAKCGQRIPFGLARLLALQHSVDLALLSVQLRRAVSWLGTQTTAPSGGESLGRRKQQSAGSIQAPCLERYRNLPPARRRARPWP